MTLGFLRRIAALSTAIAMLASPVAAAQTPAPTPTAEESGQTPLLSPAAFARLVHAPATGVAPAPAPKDPPRRDLVRQGTAAAARAAALSPQPPRRSADGWRTAGKVAVGVLLVVGVLAGLGAASYYTGVDFMPIFDGLFGGK